jgi:hypothetical protein
LDAALQLPEERQLPEQSSLPKTQTIDVVKIGRGKQHLGHSKLRKQREPESAINVHDRQLPEQLKLRMTQTIDVVKIGQGEQLPEQQRLPKTQTIDVVKIGQGEQLPERSRLRSRDEVAVKINVSDNQSHAPSVGHSWKEKRFITIRRKITMATPYFTLDK